MPQPVHNAIVTPHNDPHLCLKPHFISQNGAQSPTGSINIQRLAYDVFKPIVRFLDIIRQFHLILQLLYGTELLRLFGDFFRRAQDNIDG